MSDNPREQLEQTIQESYQVLRNDAPSIPGHLWKAIEGGSAVLLAWKKSGGAKGWSQQVVDLDGKPIFSRAESKSLEAAVQTSEPLLKNLFGETAPVAGGALADIKRLPGSSVVSPALPMDPKDISIDKVYHTIVDQLDKYDEQWKAISNELGIIQAVEARDYKGILPGPAPIPYYILGRSIFPMVNVLLEFLRVGVSNTMTDAPTFRVLLSIALAMLDLIRGEWKDALLSSFGVLSSTGVFVGVTGKLIRDAWLFIAPDLQTQLRDDIYRSTKSMFAGFLLWVVATFSPEAVRFAAEQSFAQLSQLVEQFNQKVEDVQTRVQDVAGKAGIQVDFKKIPPNMIPNFDDIQNLQSLARVPEIYCSPEVQKIMEPLLLIPPLRLVIELLNIPTLDEERKKICAGFKGKPLAETIAEAATPTVSLIPGGPLNQAQKAAEQAKDPGAALEAKAGEALGALEAKAEAAVPNLPKSPI